MISLVQLMITVVMTAMSMLSHGYFMFQLQNPWLLWVCMGLTIGIEIYIFCCNGGRTFPSNMVLLGIFTFCEGYIVSFISSVTGYQQGNSLVLLAAFLTMGNFSSLLHSRRYCLYRLCLLHWIRLHHQLLSSHHPVSYIVNLIHCNDVHWLTFN